MSKSHTGNILSKKHIENIRSSHLGLKHTEKSKQKMRLSAIKRIEKQCGQLSPSYNPEACKLIDKLGKENKYKFQHAENGGEFYIKELGYWVDGYDKEKNIVIEVDEQHHFNNNGKLKEKRHS